MSLPAAGNMHTLLYLFQSYLSSSSTNEADMQAFMSAGKICIVQSYMRSLSFVLILSPFFTVFLDCTCSFSKI